jgi:signal transduction histidine kinase
VSAALPRVLRTSSFRLTLIYAALSGFSALILLGVIYWATGEYISSSLDAAVDSDITELEDILRGGGIEALASQVKERLRQMPHGPVYYLLQDPNGKIIAGNLPPFHGGEGRFDLKVPRTDGPSVPVHAHGITLTGREYLMVGADALPRREMQKLILRVFELSSGITLVLALAGGALMSGGLLRRIETISRTARDIMAGDFSRRIPIRGDGDEFDHLALSLNAMLARNEAAMESVRQVSNDIAHDLRTPLTRLRQRLELAQRRARSVEEWRLAAERCLSDMDAILETFGGLLRIAQIESGMPACRFAKVDLSELLRTLIEVYQPMAEEKEQPFTADIASGLTVWGDRELLTQMIANVIENAMRHSPRGASIGLAASESQSTTAVAISDNGPGIPAEERIRVFQRFYRLESSRSTPGSGLGLSLVEAIAALHRMGVELTDNGPGLRVTLQFHTADQRTLTRDRLSEPQTQRGPSAAGNDPSGSAEIATVGFGKSSPAGIRQIRNPHGVANPARD